MRQRRRRWVPPPSREETERLIDELNAPSDRLPEVGEKLGCPTAIGSAVARGPRKHGRKSPGILGPFELFCMLANTCMDILSPNGWKVVCYVAVRVMGDPPEARQRSVMTNWEVRASAAISLSEFTRGLRTKRGRRDYGTGLAKSSVAAAINDAVRAGVLRREQRTGTDGRTIASVYEINWAKVREWNTSRHKARGSRAGPT